MPSSGSEYSHMIVFQNTEVMEFSLFIYKVLGFTYNTYIYFNVFFYKEVVIFMISKTKKKNKQCKVVIFSVICRVCCLVFHQEAGGVAP